MINNNLEFAKKLIAVLEKHQVDNSWLNSKVRDIDFKMFGGFYKKAFLPPTTLTEGSVSSSRIIFQLENGSKFEIPMYAETLFLKFTPIRFKNKYLYTVKCEEPSKFNIELKTILLDLLK
jgi:hypothetical protein